MSGFLKIQMVAGVICLASVAVQAYGEMTNDQCQMTNENQLQSQFSSTKSIQSISSTQLSINQNPFRYSGYYTDDETGLNYLKGRYYSPECNTFTSRDTYDLPNLYTYCGANPVMNTDPDGHDFKDFISSNTGILTTIASGMALIGGAYIGRSICRDMRDIKVANAARDLAKQRQDKENILNDMAKKMDEEWFSQKPATSVGESMIDSGTITSAASTTSIATSTSSRDVSVILPGASERDMPLAPVFTDTIAKLYEDAGHPLSPGCSGVLERSLRSIVNKDWFKRNLMDIDDLVWRWKFEHPEIPIGSNASGIADLMDNLWKACEINDCSRKAIGAATGYATLVLNRKVLNKGWDVIHGRPGLAARAVNIAMHYMDVPLFTIK